MASPVQEVINNGSCSQWDQNNSNQTLRNDDNDQVIDQVIDQVSTNITNLETEILLKLEMRAMAWARQRKYNEELRDASSMIMYAPHDATGYLITGRRYLLQGFPRRAIQVFDQGLEQVSQQSNEKKQQYDLLVQEKQRAQKQWEDKSGHFFTFLSFELICFIIDVIPQNALAQCSMVSSIWRHWILNYSKPWRHVFYGTKNSIPHFMLPVVSQHVESLVVPANKHANQYMELLQTKDFSNLLSLRILDSGNFWMRQNNQMPLYKALDRVADTLVSLDITFRRNTNVPTLDIILSICTNLTSLRFVAYERNTITPFSLFKPTTMLVKLELETVNLSREELQSILQACPFLRTLSVRRSRKGDIYKLVLNHCPNIRTLVMGDPHACVSLEESSTTVINSTQVTTHRPTGLNHLTIGEDAPCGSELMPIFEEYHSSLTQLDLFQSHCDPRLTRPDWQRLASLGFMHLTHFNFVGVIRALCQHFKALLATMPNLVSIRLESLLRAGEEKIPNGALLALTREKLPRLSELSMHDVAVNPDDLCHVLETFNTTVTERKQQQQLSSLTKLDLRYVMNVDQTLMTACTRIQSLKSLYITHSPSVSHCTEPFIQGLSNLPVLEHLGLSRMKMTGEDLQKIGANIALKSVRLMDMMGITTEQVNQSFSPHVKVTFYEADNDDYDDYGDYE